MSIRSLLLVALAVYALASPASAHHVAKSGIPRGPAANAPMLSIAGYMDEIAIDNRVAGTMSRVAVLIADDGNPYVLGGAAASGMTVGATYTLTGRANGKALFVETLRMTALFDPRRARAIAAPTTVLSGTLRLGHADNFDGTPSEFFYAIVTDTQQYRISLATLLDGLENGMRANVSGRIGADGELFTDAIVIIRPPEKKAKADFDAKAVVTTSYLVMPIKFPTNATPPFVYNADPFTVASLSSAVFGGPPIKSVAEYYAETSYGQQLLSGAVADNGSGGWLLANQAVPATCDINAIASAAETAATARGYNLASYIGRAYVFSNNVPGCGWSGLAYVGWERTWVKQSTNLLVFGHEFGHNFGLLHAASLDCGANVIGGSCTSAEYGDPFDIMGNQRAMHFNTAQKFDLGWIPSTSVKTHVSGTATYTLAPLESPGGATYAVKIPAAANRTYWLEYRQPIGFDSALSAYPNNGAQFRVAFPFESLCAGCDDDTEFLDLTPATATFTDGTLVAGQSYTDTTYGFTVNVTSASPTALTLNVTAPGGAGGFAPGVSYVLSASNAGPTIITSIAAVCPASGILVVNGSGESAAQSSFAGTAFIGIAYSVARNSTATDNGNVVQSSALATFNGDANRDFLHVQRFDNCSPGQTYNYYLTAYATTPQTSIANVSFVWNGRLVVSEGPASSSFAAGTTYVNSATNATPTIVTSLAVTCPASGMLAVVGSGESAAQSNFAGNAFVGLAYSIARGSSATDNGNVVQSSALAVFNGDANRDFLNVQRVDSCTPAVSYTYNLTVYATTPQTNITTASFVWNGRLTAIIVPVATGFAPGTTFIGSATNAAPTVVISMNIVCPASGTAVITASGESAAQSSFAGNAFIGLAYSIARDSTATDNGIVVQSSALAKFNGDANRDFLNVQRSDTCTPGQPHTYFLTAYATTPQTSIPSVSFVWNGRLAAMLPP